MKKVTKISNKNLKSLKEQLALDFSGDWEWIYPEEESFRNAGILYDKNKGTILKIQTIEKDKNNHAGFNVVEHNYLDTMHLEKAVRELPKYIENYENLKNWINLILNSNPNLNETKEMLKLALERVKSPVTEKKIKPKKLTKVSVQTVRRIRDSITSDINILDDTLPPNPTQ